MKDDPRSVLLHARAPEHAAGAAALAGILARRGGGRITILEVVEEGRPSAPTAEGLAAALRAQALAVQVKRVTARNPVEAVVAESANHDLLIVGASERWALQRSAFGPIVDDIAATARCPVVLFRKGERSASGG